MRLVQISDTHLFADPSQGKLLGLNTAQSFESVLALIKTSPVQAELAVLTGDLSQDETQGAYDYLSQSCEQLDCPVYWIAGNHDDLPLMEKIFSHTKFKQEKAILWGNWLFILLNTHYAHHVEGWLGKHELSQLDYYLSQHPEQHVLIFMHHPPVALGSKWLDKLGLKNQQDFFNIIDKYSHIRGIICGHVHQESELSRKNVRIFTTPSTCVQFKPQTADFALDTLNPGYRWFDLNTDGSFETAVERVKDFNHTADPLSTGY